MPHLFTIGFTGTTAEWFFARLQQAGVKRVIDTRAFPDTQLSGFAKRRDLAFFLQQLVGIEYMYRADLAPPIDLLNGYKNKHTDWAGYVPRYLAALEQRDILKDTQIQDWSSVCLLCAEASPQFCHRRLLAEYVQEQRSDWCLQIKHL